MTEGYRICTKYEDMDLSVIHGFLSQSYWACAIPMAVLSVSLRNSMCFGIFSDSVGQVGFARVITDKATFAYLADVFVLNEHRGKGLSKGLVTAIIEHPDLQGLRRIMLATRDAHGLYEKFGFKSLASTQAIMELHVPDVYAKG